MLTAHGTSRSPVAIAEDDARFFEALRAAEFARLDEQDEAYLDYTGSALYAARQVRSHADALLGGVYGNPHSESRPSRASTEAIAQARHEVLRFLDASEGVWEVVFTANATGAIRLVAESYPFDASHACVLAADNHNSVNGIREVARARDARVHYLPLDAELRLDDAEAHLDALARVGTRGLVAFPAQSNFSGVRHPLSIAAAARARGFDVLLDAASYAPSAPLSLDALPVDFVPLSFYKLFGYPTGIGALLVRRASLAKLERRWFAGGTVQFASVQRPVHLLKAGAEGFEDGTPSFLAASALPQGFALLAEVGMERLQRRVALLTARLLDRLTALRHRDGSAAVIVHGPRTLAARGGCVAFNVRDRRGDIVPYERVETLARSARVSLRGGCFCNPGAAERAFDFPAIEAARCQDEAQRRGFSVPRFRDCLRDRAVGALRISVGLATNERDVERVVQVVAESAWL